MQQMAFWLAIALFGGPVIIGCVVFLKHVRWPKVPPRTRSKLERGREKVVK